MIEIQTTYLVLIGVFILGCVCGGIWAYDLAKKKVTLSTEIRLLEAQIEKAKIKLENQKRKRDLLNKIAEEQNGILQRKNARI